jgi:hypothetical protein
MIHCRGNERCPHRAWRDCVDSDTTPNVLVAETASKRHNRSFRRCVVEKIRATNVRIYAGIVYYSRTLFHMRKCVFGEIEKGVDVCLESHLPLLSAYSVSNFADRGCLMTSRLTPKDL